VLDEIDNEPLDFGNILSEEELRRVFPDCGVSDEIVDDNEERCPRDLLDDNVEEL
jgi:hypothetical protein